MSRCDVVTVALCALSLTSCLSHPQTAAEFRNAVPGAATASMDTFEVNRPLAQVAASFQKLASDCLGRTIRTTEHQPHVSYQVLTTTYKPTVLVSANQAELHVQQRHRGNVINVSAEPDGGYYLLVADARPVGPGKTRIELYRPSMGHSALVQAVRSWAAGENAGCPDLIG